MKAAKKIVYVLCSLSLCFSYEGKIAYGQTIICNEGNFQNGAICGNVNHLHQTIVYPNHDTPAVNSGNSQNPLFTIGKPVDRKIFVSTEEPPSPGRTWENHPAFEIKN